MLNRNFIQYRAAKVLMHFLRLQLPSSPVASSNQRFPRATGVQQSTASCSQLQCPETLSQKPGFAQTDALSNQHIQGCCEYPS